MSKQIITPIAVPPTTIGWTRLPGDERAPFPAEQMRLAVDARKRAVPVEAGGAVRDPSGDSLGEADDHARASLARRRRDGPSSSPSGSSA